jgi:hypothetical protein
MRNILPTPPPNGIVQVLSLSASQLAVIIGPDVSNAVPDPLGDDYQWFTVSAGYATEKWWLPGVRVGYRKNLAGTELDYIGVGVTALKILNIDIASAVDTVSISGKTLPRGLMASIGFQIAW